jgi:sodium pump decarboxylase gamma subunit
MKKAALNTVLGMGTVFAVLILISLIISAFTLIPKIQAMFSKKEEKKASDTENAVDNTIAQIIETQERYDDTELVAVISAAIAAYEAEQGTAVPADGVVIRSIRKVNKSKWQNV